MKKSYQQPASKVILIQSQLLQTSGYTVNSYAQKEVEELGGD